MRHRHPTMPIAIGLAVGLAVAACLPMAGPPSPTPIAPASLPSGSSATPTPAPVASGPLATRSPSPPTPRPSATARPAPATPPPPSARAWIQRSLQAALDETRTRLRIPGAQVTILFPDGTSWTGVSGLADVTAKAPVTADTAFSIASISKTFLAALILELIAEGSLRLDAPVDGLLPDLAYRAGPGVTVRMLLDHTSGLHDYFLNPRIDRALQGDPSRRWSAARALTFVGRPYFPPGTNWHYSNTNYLLLGLVAERVTGRPLAEELRRRFLEPLGLDGTWYQAVEGTRPSLAHGYRVTGSGAKTRAIDLADGTGVAPFRSVVTAAGGAGSLAATSGNVAAWARALYGGRAIDGESLSLMLSGIDRVAGYRPRVPYGLGVQAIVVDGHRTFGHSGRFLGFRSVMRWLPDEGVAIAVLTNQSRADINPLVARLIRIALPEPGRPPAPIAY
jgi:D-alanyl-D-alanine carboxypeptidase